MNKWSQYKYTEFYVWKVQGVVFISEMEIVNKVSMQKLRPWDNYL